MKKIMKTICAVLVIATSVVACVKKEEAGQSSEAVSVAVEASTEQNETGIANPWTETTTQELEERFETTIALPEGAKNVYCQIMEEDGLGEVAFDYMDHSCTYRLKKTDVEEDISGMYYEWNTVETVLLSDCNATYQTCTEGDDLIELTTWYNGESKTMYSLSAVGGAGDGYDILDVAGTLYASVNTENNAEDRVLEDVELSEQQTEDMTTIAYALLRGLPGGTYTQEQLKEALLAKSDYGHPLGSLLWFLYFPKLTQTEMREEPKVYTCGYYSLDEPQNMLKDLFSWDADLSVLSANNESEWGNWGTIYENGQLLLYMGGIGLMKDCAFQGLTPMGDGMSAFRVEQGIEGFDLPGEITLYLEDADNSYGCRIVGCEITKTS